MSLRSDPLTESFAWPAPSGRDSDLTPLHGGIRLSTIRALLGVAVPLTVSRGDVILRQGDRPKLVIVLDGLVAVRRSSSRGQRFTLTLIRHGHAFGILATSPSSRARFDLVALSPARVLLLPGAAVRRMAHQDAGLAIALLDVAISTLGLVYERLDAATFETARTRIASVALAHESILAGQDAAITRIELAGLIGASREMLDRALRDLEGQGILARRGRRLLVLDRAALREVAGWSEGGVERTHQIRALLD